MTNLVRPGSPLALSIETFDDRVDAWLEQVRGNALADQVFNTASTFGDFSVLWHLVGALRALSDKRTARQSFELSLFVAAESLIVNQGVKRLFKRTRPTPGGDERYEVRTPSTSSFPSGHASSAFFAATLLTSMTARRYAALWYGLAGIVALSRPYVRIHHASDVVGGAALGLTLGALANRLRRAWSR